MARINFLLPIAIALAVCFGCTPSPVQMGMSQAPPGKILTCNFLSKIQVLQPGYSPVSNPYSPPTDPGNIRQNYQLRQKISDDLSAAFTNAPAGVQNDLCALTAVFIDTHSCVNGDLNNCQNLTGAFPVSWGYRSPNQNDRGAMYIAVPGILWAGGGDTNATVFSAYEGTVLSYFAQNAGNPSRGTSWAPLPTISGADPDLSWPTVLAALAHELGHVKFNVTIHPNATYGNNYTFAALQPCNIGGGHTIPDFFSGWSYNNPTKLVPKDRWRAFAHQESDDNGRKLDHSMPPYLADFLNPSNNPNQLLYALYTGDTQGWAGLWGAWSPDEDFVETYVLYALLGNVKHLKINISGFAPYDIIAGVPGKPVLANKIQCLANLPVISGSFRRL
jgi:hypothetical protein